MRSTNPKLLALPASGADGGNAAKIDTCSLILAAHGLSKVLENVVENEDVESRLEVVDALQAVMALLVNRVNDGPLEMPKARAQRRRIERKPLAGERDMGALQ